MGTFEDERAHRQLCWSKSGSSRLTLCHPRHGHHRPAKNEQNVSFPSGHWGTLGLCRTYVTVPALRKRESGRARQPLSHRGDENFARSLRHSPPVVDHKRSQLCKRESGMHVSNFPIGALGSFQGLCGTLHTVVDRSFGRSCASESQYKHVNHFPIGVMGNFQGLCGTYIL